jgi:hypothetical protein
LNKFFNYNLKKGIKKNVLNNPIYFKKNSWINIAYIYVSQCSYNTFDYIMLDIRILKATKSIMGGLQAK